MKKNAILFVGAMCATFCTAAMVQSCQKSKLQVYDVKSVVTGKIITVVEGESVTMQVKPGDSVFVNLNDSEITEHLTERRAIFYNPNHMKVDSTELYVVKSTYLINK